MQRLEVRTLVKVLAEVLALLVCVSGEMGLNAVWRRTRRAEEWSAERTTGAM